MFHSTDSFQSPDREMPAPVATTPAHKSTTAVLAAHTIPASTLLLANLSASPDNSSQSIYSELISSQDELIASLQSQLSIQSEISMQFEVDLKSRDEHVEILAERVETAEKEMIAWRTDGERRKSAMKAWKKRIGQLETLCLKLESEVASGKQEKEERSVMDMASHEAMKALHHRARTLESARTDLESKLKDAEIQLEREKDLTASFKAQLPGADQDQVEKHANNLDKVSRERDEALAKLASQREEMSVLRAELEAQWRNTELMDEKVKAMTRERKEALDKCGAIEVERDRLRDNLSSEKRLFEDQKATWESTVEELETQRAEAFDRVAMLEEEVQVISEAKNAIETERDQVNDFCYQRSEIRS